jgi:very-short-patch-repair endonuclease
LPHQPLTEKPLRKEGLFFDHSTEESMNTLTLPEAPAQPSFMGLRHLTHHEHMLWRLLRRQPPAGHAFLRSQPVGSHQATFFCPDAHLALEVDGFERLDPDQEMALARRRAEFVRLGVMELRVSSREVRQEPDMVLSRITDCVLYRVRWALPLPSLATSAA